MATYVSLAALVIAMASAVVAHLRHRNLKRRIDVAVQESETSLAHAVSESTDRLKAWVRSIVDDSNTAQLETATDTLTRWSADLVTDVEAILVSFRATVKSDTAALVGQALTEYEGEQERAETFDPR